MSKAIYLNIKKDTEFKKFVTTQGSPQLKKAYELLEAKKFVLKNLPLAEMRIILSSYRDFLFSKKPDLFAKLEKTPQKPSLKDKAKKKISGFKEQVRSRVKPYLSRLDQLTDPEIDPQASLSKKLTKKLRQQFDPTLAPIYATRKTLGILAKMNRVYQTMPSEIDHIYSRQTLKNIPSGYTLSRVVPWKDHGLVYILTNERDEVLFIQAKDTKGETDLPEWRNLRDGSLAVLHNLSEMMNVAVDGVVNESGGKIALRHIEDKYGINPRRALCLGFAVFDKLENGFNGSLSDNIRDINLTAGRIDGLIIGTPEVVANCTANPLLIGEFLATPIKSIKDTLHARRIAIQNHDYYNQGLIEGVSVGMTGLITAGLVPRVARRLGVSKAEKAPVEAVAGDTSGKTTKLQADSPVDSLDIPAPEEIPLNDIGPTEPVQLATTAVLNEAPVRPGSDFPRDTRPVAGLRQAPAQLKTNGADQPKFDGKPGEIKPTGADSPPEPELVSVRLQRPSEKRPPGGADEFETPPPPAELPGRPQGEIWADSNERTNPATNAESISAFDDVIDLIKRRHHGISDNIENILREKLLQLSQKSPSDYRQIIHLLTVHRKNFYFLMEIYDGILQERKPVEIIKRIESIKQQPDRLTLYTHEELADMTIRFFENAFRNPVDTDGFTPKQISDILKTMKENREFFKERLLSEGVFSKKELYYYLIFKIARTRHKLRDLFERYTSISKGQWDQIHIEPFHTRETILKNLRVTDPDLLMDLRTILRDWPEGKLKHLDATCRTIHEEFKNSPLLLKKELGTLASKIASEKKPGSTGPETPPPPAELPGRPQGEIGETGPDGLEQRLISLKQIKKTSGTILEELIKIPENSPEYIELQRELLKLYQLERDIRRGEIPIDQTRTQGQINPAETNGSNSPPAPHLPETITGNKWPSRTWGKTQEGALSSTELWTEISDQQWRTLRGLNQRHQLPTYYGETAELGRLSPRDPHSGAPAIINDSVVDVFEKPTAPTRRISQALLNEEVTVLGYDKGSGEWAEVKLNNGSCGWILKSHLTFPKSSGVPVLGRGVVVKNNVPLINITLEDSPLLELTRENPSITIATVPLGSEFEITRVVGKYFEVKAPDGKLAYILKENLDLRTSVGASPQRVVEIAREYQGAKFGFGASSPLETDCAGLTYQVFRRLGINLPRDADVQYLTGKAVKLSQLQKGDLVFSNDGKGVPNHVAVYLGEGKIIHSVKGRGVVIDPLSNYTETVLGARRLLYDNAPRNWMVELQEKIVRSGDFKNPKPAIRGEALEIETRETVDSFEPYQEEFGRAQRLRPEVTSPSREGRNQGLESEIPPEDSPLLFEKNDRALSLSEACGMLGYILSENESWRYATTLRRIISEKGLNEGEKFAQQILDANNKSGAQRSNELAQIRYRLSRWNRENPPSGRPQGRVSSGGKNSRRLNDKPTYTEADEIIAYNLGNKLRSFKMESGFTIKEPLSKRLLKSRFFCQVLTLGEKIKLALWLEKANPIELEMLVEYLKERLEVERTIDTLLDPSGGHNLLFGPETQKFLYKYTPREMAIGAIQGMKNGWKQLNGKIDSRPSEISAAPVLIPEFLSEFDVSAFEAELKDLSLSQLRDVHKYLSYTQFLRRNQLKSAISQLNKEMAFADHNVGELSRKIKEDMKPKKILINHAEQLQQAEHKLYDKIERARALQEIYRRALENIPEGKDPIAKALKMLTELIREKKSANKK